MATISLAAAPAHLPRQRRHIPGLTGLRGIAAWWVVLFHFREFLPPTAPWVDNALAHGYLAVDLFFVLSGFIIAYNYLHLFASFDRRTYLHFLGIRLARIYPLHLFMLVIFLANPIAIALAASQGIDWVRYGPGYYLMSIVLVQNWGISPDLAWNVPAWSISTEWFAYLIFPALAWVAVKAARPAVAVAGVVLPLILLALVLDWMGIGLGDSIPRNGLPRCIAEFTAGMFVYRVWLLSDDRRIYNVGALMVLAATLAAYIALDLPERWTLPLIWACSVLFLATGQNVVVRVCATPWMEYVGVLSYATYLCHYFVRDWVKFLLIRQGTPSWLPVLCYLAAVAVASVFLYRFIEVPGRRYVRDLVNRAVTPAPAGQE